MHTGMRTRNWLCVVGLIAAGGTACGGGEKGVRRGPAGATAESAQLARLGVDVWQWTLQTNPVMATHLGVPGYDDQLSDASLQGIEKHRGLAKSFLARADAIAIEGLTSRERITRSILIHELTGGVEGAVCKGELWMVDHLWGPQVWFLNLGTQTRVKTEDDEDNYLSRLSKFGTYVDQKIAGLRVGLEQGLVAPKLNIERSLRQLEELAALSTDDFVLLQAAAGIPEARRAQFRKAIAAEVDETVRPAYRRYTAFLTDELLPRARDAVGVGALPLGAPCYAALIRSHTSRDDTPQQLHDLGLSEMTRIRGEMEALSAKLFPGKPLEQVLPMLRDDPVYGFTSRDEVEAAAVTAVKRAESKLAEAFSVLPQAPVEVQRLEAHAEKDSPMAYYRNPSSDGEQPGTYYVNTYLPEKRPRYTAEVLAFHEAVPGHHLQIAIAMEVPELPEFQKHAGTTAFTEGWGLYSERLSQEMGLYTGDMDLLGMLSFDAWRAARLVVDTGMHSLGWTRQQAIDYMAANTASTLPDIENEVDRYITWPAQALAYKVGQIEILRLREKARRQLGDKFDLREFHKRVLQHGAVPLGVLAEEIDRWIDGV